MILKVRTKDHNKPIYCCSGLLAMFTVPHPGLSHHQSRQLAAADRRRPVSPSHTGSTPTWFDCAPIIMTTMTSVTNVQSVHDVSDRISYLSILLQQQQSLLCFRVDVKDSHNNVSILFNLPSVAFFIFWLEVSTEYHAALSFGQICTVNRCDV